MKQEILKISKQRKQIKKGYLGVYQKEKVSCDRRMEVEIDVWEVRKLERSKDVGNCVNREVGVHDLQGLCDEKLQWKIR